VSLTENPPADAGGSDLFQTVTVALVAGVDPEGEIMQSL